MPRAVFVKAGILTLPHPKERKLCFGQSLKFSGRRNEKKNFFPHLLNEKKMKFIPSEIFFEERFKDGGYGLLAAYRRARGSSRFAWYKGRRPPGAVSVFIA